MTKQALIELRGAIAGGKEHQVVGKVFAAFGSFGEPERGKSWFAYNAYNGSLDAAVAFLGAVLPGWIAEINTFGMATIFQQGNYSQEPISAACKGNPARALLLATLDALIARAE